MPRNCPWCGRELELKSLDLGSSIRHICSKCGFKIKEFLKPEPPKQEVKPEPVEIRPEEIPIAKQTPAWPFIVGAAGLIIVVILIVKLFLL